MVIHTIRPDLTDGFLLAYHEALEKSDEGLGFNPAEVVAVPEVHHEWSIDLEDGDFAKNLISSKRRCG